MELQSVMSANGPEDDAMVLMMMMKFVHSNSRYLQLKHIMQGVEGYADFVFPFIVGRLCLQEDGTIKPGHRIARLLFVALEERSKYIANTHLPTLFGKRDEIDMDDIDTLAKIDGEIVTLQQLSQDYNDFFGEEDFRRLNRLLTEKLTKRLQSHANEQACLHTHVDKDTEKRKHSDGHMVHSSTSKRAKH
jgi:hypothetical protein